VQITFDLSGDLIQLPPPVSAPREPAIAAPASTAGSSTGEQQRRQDQAFRASQFQALSFRNAVTAQEARSPATEDTAPEQSRPAGIAAYEDAAARASVEVLKAQSAAAAQPDAIGPVAPQAFVNAASAYTDQLIAAADYARPGETLKLQA